jgi:hypothetical protein
LHRDDFESGDLSYWSKVVGKHAISSETLDIGI